MAEQICLKWNSFHSNIVSNFKNLWEEEGLVDVTLASDGQCIRAHKVILSACSPFFKTIFQSNPCQHPVIILQDVRFTEVESLLSFVYKGEVNIQSENLPALLRAAETLQIRGLSGASEQVKQKMAISKTGEKSREDGSPPPKRRRDGVKSRSPPPPSTPSAATPTPRIRHNSHSYAEPSQPSEVSSKMEPDDSEPPSPITPAICMDDSLDESAEESMELMAKHSVLEADQLNELEIQSQLDMPEEKFFAGMSYPNWAEFEAAFNDWAEAGYHPMCITKSHTNNNPTSEHPYMYVNYACKHHGKPRSRGKNIRPKQHFNAQECPVRVRVHFMIRSKTYLVKEVNGEHNHPVSAELRAQYPDRRLPKGVEVEAIAQLIRRNVQVRDIKTFARCSMGKPLNGKDVHNLRRKVKLGSVDASETDSEQYVIVLPYEPEYDVEVQTMDT